MQTQRPVALTCLRLANGVMLLVNRDVQTGTIPGGVAGGLGPEIGGKSIKMMKSAVTDLVQLHRLRFVCADPAVGLGIWDE
jgi:hypothetical protein